MSTSEQRASSSTRIGERPSVSNVPLVSAPVSSPSPSSRVNSCASALPLLLIFPNPLGVGNLDKGGPLTISDLEDEEEADPITLTIGENGRAP